MASEPSLRAQAPWYVSGTRTRHHSMPVLQIISEPTGEVLALIPYSDHTPKAHAESYADARLIAAAPDLLAALRQSLQFARSMQQHGINNTLMVIEPIERAIAKAEGVTP